MESGSVGGSKNRYSIRVLDRAFSILQILSDGRPRNLVGLSAEADLDTSTTFRLLAALQDHRFLSRDPRTGEYSLGVACVELARSYLGTSVVSITLPHLIALRDATRETVHLAVLDRLDVIYVDKQQGLHAVGFMSSHIGGRSPAHCTGVGKALLAFQDPDAVRASFEGQTLYRFTSATITDVDLLMRELGEVRDRGYAVDRGEHEDDVYCVAAPVFDATGRAVAAISVAGPASRMDPIDEQADAVAQVLSTTSRVSALLGAAPDTAPREQQQFTRRARVEGLNHAGGH